MAPGPGAELAPRPAPGLRASPPPASGPPPIAGASVLPLPGLGSPSGRASGAGKLHSPLPAPLARQSGCTAGRSPTARGTLSLAESDCRLELRGAARAARLPKKACLFPAAACSQPQFLPGLPAPAPRGAFGGHAGPAGGRDAKCEQAVSGGQGIPGAWPRGSESLCSPLEHTLRPRRWPGYLRLRQRLRASRVGRREAQHPPRPAGSLCFSSAAAWSSLPGASPGRPRVGVGLEDQPPSTCEGPPTKSGEGIP